METKSNTTANQKEQSNITLLYLLSLPFRIASLPFFAIYMILFEVPNKPSYLVGVLRFSFFVLITLLSGIIKNFIDDTCNNYKLHEYVPVLIWGIFSIIMLWNLFLTFMEIFGFCAPKGTSNLNWSNSSSEGNSINSEYDSFDNVLEYRDSLLAAKHTPGKIEELKKTGFITRERISDMSASP
jgi:hypothetical protein